MAVTIQRLHEGETYSVRTGSETGRVVYQAPGVRADDAIALLIAAGVTDNHPDDSLLDGLLSAQAVERIGNATDGMGWKVALEFGKKSSGRFSPPPPNFADADYDEFSMTFGTIPEELPLISRIDAIYTEVLPPKVAGPPLSIEYEDYRKDTITVLVPFTRIERTVTVSAWGSNQIRAVALQNQKLHDLFGTGENYIFEGADVRHVTDEPKTFAVSYTWRREEATPAIPAPPSGKVLEIPMKPANGKLAVIPVPVSAPASTPNQTTLEIVAYTETQLRATGSWTNLPGLI